MPYLHGTARSEVLLFPEAISDYITEENPVRFINAFVASLDFFTAALKTFVILLNFEPVLPSTAETTSKLIYFAGSAKF